MSGIAILGWGLSGLACIDFLAQSEKQLTIFDVQSKPPPIQFPHCKLIFKQTDFLDPTCLIHFDRIILSPGISKAFPAIAAAVDLGIPLDSEIELFAKAAQAPVVAITGSNGKSTVTTWLGEMAKACGIKVAVGGNLGPAALQLLSDDIELYILELSSFQLETTASLKPRVACILNVSPDHLDRYPSFEAYRQAKLRIFQGAKQGVFNRDQPEIKVDLPGVNFGLDHPRSQSYGLITQNQRSYLAFGEQILCPTTDLQVLGRHNIENALATLALAQLCHFPQAACLAALKTFTGLSHRCEKVAEVDEILWINDSKATNVQATVAALTGLAECLSGSWILIAGGRSKGSDFSLLKEPVQRHARMVILFGEAACELETALAGVVQIQRCASLEEAVCFARDLVQPKEGVLFSPACASFDQFENFKVRGDRFKTLVQTRVYYENSASP